MILVMTVEPGFGGQAFMPDMLPKIEALRNAVGSRPIDIEVDGGINAETGALTAKAGATVAVVGSALFNAGEEARALVRRLQAL